VDLVALGVFDACDSAVEVAVVPFVDADLNLGDREEASVGDKRLGGGEECVDVAGVEVMLDRLEAG
jgi:hypothetical protein